MDKDNFQGAFNPDGMSPRHMHITNINFSDAMQNDLKKVLLIQDDVDGHNNIDIRNRERLNATMISGI
jgi:hypothetical protein